MSVNVSICTQAEDSSEYRGIIRIQQYFQESIPEYVNGQICLFSSLTMHGQKVRDLDILVVGEIEGYRMENCYTNDTRYPKKDVVVNNFCCTIELKEH